MGYRGGRCEILSHHLAPDGHQDEDAAADDGGGGGKPLQP